MDIEEALRWAEKNCTEAGTLDRLTSRRVARVLTDEIDRLRIGHDRYQVARRMTPQQWAEAWKLNISTGKPFDEIVDNLRPFMTPNVY